jgi:Co/Zn/Cd efflux system component
MEHCCEAKSTALEGLRHTQARTLQLVLALNALMFFIELAAGWWSASAALLGDSLDMFADATVYGVTLYVLDRGPVLRARAAILKGLTMAVLGLAVLARALLTAYDGGQPHAVAMGSVGLLALAVNVACLGLLLRHRRDDLNMSSAWTCSRNDIIANVALLLAAWAVRVTSSGWPDVLVGASLAGLFLASALRIVRQGHRALQRQSI